MKSCFFIGHEDDVPKHLEQRLESTVEQLIEELFVEEYVVADHYYHHPRLTEMLCRVLGRAKERHPGLNLRLAVPHPKDCLSPSLPPGFDQIYLPPELEGMPPRQADDRLDRLLVEQATHLVACVSHFSWDSYRAFADARGRAARGELFLFTLV